MASKAIEETFAWLRERGIMVPAPTVTHPFSLDECDAISHAFHAGDYANAYEGNDLESALEDFNGGDAPEGTIGFNRPDHERFAFILGFFSAYALDEIGCDREAYDEAYFSPAGRYVVKVARYCDDRFDEYAAEADDLDDEDLDDEDLDEQGGVP